MVVSINIAPAPVHQPLACKWQDEVGLGLVGEIFAWRRDCLWANAKTGYLIVDVEIPDDDKGLFDVLELCQAHVGPLCEIVHRGFSENLDL